MGIALGLLSALVWGIAGVTGGLAARRIGGFRTVAYSMAFSVVVAIPIALLTGPPGRVDTAALLWVLLIAGMGLTGIVLVYTAMRMGSISVVAPISATYGGVGALIALATGEPTSPLALGGILIAIVGAFLAARGDTSTPGVAYPHQARAALLAGACALVWGVQLWAGGQVQDEIGPSWVVAGMRLIGVVAIGIPVLARGPLVRDRRVLALVLVTGLGELMGFTLYLVASGYGVAQAAVLTGQYGTVAALIGVLVLKERLQRVQFVGIGLIVVAVVLLALPG